MPSISYRIKSKKNKLVSIYLSLRPQGSKPIYSRTGFSIHPEQWSESKKRAKPNSPENKNLNTLLNNLEIHVANLLNGDIQKGFLIDNNWLRKVINKFNNKVDSFDLTYATNLLDELILNLKYKKAKDGSIGLKKNTIKGYITFRKNLVDYEKFIGAKIKINELGKEEIDGYTKWLLEEQKYANSEVSRKIKRLKRLLKFALEKRISLNINIETIGGDYNYKTKKYINVLNENDFIKIAKLKSLPVSLENVKNWILIGLTIGQRISDLKKIKQDEIRYDKNGIALIDVIQVKGEEPVTIPIKNQLVIDILKHKFPYPISDQKFNDYMKEVCRRAGINDIVKGYKFNPKTKRKELLELPKYEFIASHDMRRSFATYHLEKNLPINLIMKITGHKRESTFYEYIDRKPKKDIDAYNFLNAIR